MSLTVGSVISRAGVMLNDASFVHWTKEELVNYFNDAVKAVIRIEPQSGAQSLQHTCTAGVKQVLPGSAQSLIDVVSNSTGKALTKADRASLDSNYNDWYAGNSAAYVSAYAYEATNPKVFWLYPGPAAGVVLDVIMAIIPDDVALANIDTTAMPISDTYVNPVLDWIMYRAYLKDSDIAANSSRSGGHYTAFNNFFGSAQ